MEKYKRPASLGGRCIRIETGCGNTYVIINRTVEGKIMEVFTKVGKTGQCNRAQLEALTRSITLGLKYGIPLEEYIKQLEGIRCPSPVNSRGKFVLSCADAIAQALEEEVNSANGKGKDTGS